MKKLIFLIAALPALCNAQTFLYEQGLSVGFNRVFTTKVGCGITHKSIYLGLSAGVDDYYNNPTPVITAPLTLDIRTAFKGRVVPVMAISGGYSLPLSISYYVNSGFVAATSAGIAVNLKEATIHISAGGKMQSFTTEVPASPFLRSGYNSTLIVSYGMINLGVTF